MNSASSSKLDLRSYLQYVREKGKSAYLEVSKEISPRWETTAVVSELARNMRNPVVYFENIADCEMPMVSNVCCSIERVAKSIGLSGEQLSERLTQVMDKLISPQIVHEKEAPVREMVYRDDEFSLRNFPQLFYTSTQTDPYITGALIVARDPDSGMHNLSFHRLMIYSNNSVAIFMTPGGHLDQIWRKNSEKELPTPLSAVLGTHPLWSYASLVSGPLEHEDYSIMGAALGAAIRLTPGLLDQDLLVPALAEIVLEGRIEPRQCHAEGPFGEFLGFVADRAPRPIIRFSMMSSRKKPIFHDIVAGGSEHLTMSSVALRVRLRRDYFAAHPAVTDFLLPAAMTLFLSIDSSRQRDFDAAALMKKLLDEERYLKQVICFDSGVDLRKQSSVQSALACHVQANRDIRIFDGYPGNGVDPSEVDGKTAKMSIDARIKTGVVLNALPDEFLAKFDLADWTE